MAAKTHGSKLISEASEQRTLAVQQRQLPDREDSYSNTAVAGHKINQSAVQSASPDKYMTAKAISTQEIVRNVQNSLASSPLSSLEANTSNTGESDGQPSGRAKTSSVAGQRVTIQSSDRSSPQPNRASARREVTTDQGSDRVTKQSSPASARREMTTGQGSDRVTQQASPASARREVTTGQGSDRVTQQASPASARREVTTGQGSDRVTQQASPASARREVTTGQGSDRVTQQASPASARREVTTGQGSDRVTQQASPASARREVTTGQGSDRVTQQASPASARREVTTGQGSDRVTQQASPASTTREMAFPKSGERKLHYSPGNIVDNALHSSTDQSSERATVKASPETKQRERSMHWSSIEHMAEPAVKSTAPAKPARSSEVKPKPDRLMERGLPVLHTHTPNVSASPKTKPKHDVSEQAVNKETAVKLHPPTPPSAKLKPRPPPFTLPEDTWKEPEGQKEEAFSVAADLESPPESPKAKPDSVIARQLSEQAEEEELFFSRQESFGTKSSQDVYKSELLTDPKLRQLHDMFPNEEVDHLQKLLEKNKGEVEKAVAVLIGEPANPSQQQTPEMPTDGELYDEDHTMGEHTSALHIQAIAPECSYSCNGCVHCLSAPGREGLAC